MTPFFRPNVGGKTVYTLLKVAHCGIYLNQQHMGRIIMTKNPHTLEILCRVPHYSANITTVLLWVPTVSFLQRPANLKTIGQ